MVTIQVDVGGNVLVSGNRLTTPPIWAAQPMQEEFRQWMLPKPELTCIPEANPQDLKERILEYHRAYIRRCSRVNVPLQPYDYQLSLPPTHVYPVYKRWGLTPLWSRTSVFFEGDRGSLPHPVPVAQCR